jgi:hypothetical protein
MCLRHITLTLGEVAGRRLDTSEVAPGMPATVFDTQSNLRAPNGLLAIFHDELAYYCFT